MSTDFGNQLQLDFSSLEPLAWTSTAVTEWSGIESQVLFSVFSAESSCMLSAAEAIHPRLVIQARSRESESECCLFTVPSALWTADRGSTEERVEFSEPS